MLGRLRAAHAVRAVSCLAALLSLAGSLGLHPEPGSAHGIHAGAAFASATPAAPSAATHACLLCLLYGSTFPSRGASVVHGVLPGLPRVVADQATRHGLVLAPDRGGRAPPSVL